RRRKVNQYQKVTHEFDRSVNHLSVKKKLRLPSVLFDQAQSKLEILEQMRTQVAHGHSFGLRALDQATNRALVENNFQSMFLTEFVGEFTHSGFEHLGLELVALGH